MTVIAFHPSQTVTGGRQVVSHQATCAGTLQLKGQPGGLCKPSAITEDAPIFFSSHKEVLYLLQCEWGITQKDLLVILESIAFICI